MRHMKTEPVPATTQEVEDKVTCDLCGATIKAGSYDAEEVDVRHRTGCSYPEGGIGEEVSVDMCGNCFDTKLVPWLRSQGANPTPKDWDW